MVKVAYVLIGVAIGYVLQFDSIKAHYYVLKDGDSYKELMFQCDHAMREHFIAKQAVIFETNDLTVKNLKSAEVGLIHCHDYDKMRKHLKLNGVSDEKLSLLGLEAIEEKEYELAQFVKIHEFKYN